MTCATERLRELLAAGGKDLPWEIDDPAHGYMRIMGQPDGDADEYGRSQVTWPHIADIIDAGDYDQVAALIVEAVNALPGLLDTLDTLTAERDAAVKRAEGAEDDYHRVHRERMSHFTRVIEAETRAAAAEERVRVLEDALTAILPPALCGEGWNLPHGETVSIVVTFSKLKAARNALSTKEAGDE